MRCLEAERQRGREALRATLPHGAERCRGEGNVRENMQQLVDLSTDLSFYEKPTDEAWWF